MYPIMGEMMWVKWSKDLFTGQLTFRPSPMIRNCVATKKREGEFKRLKTVSHVGWLDSSLEMG